MGRAQAMEVEGHVGAPGAGFSGDRSGRLAHEGTFISQVKRNLNSSFQLTLNFSTYLYTSPLMLWTVTGTYSTVSVHILQEGVGVMRGSCRAQPATEAEQTDLQKQPVCILPHSQASPISPEQLEGAWMLTAVTFWEKARLHLTIRCVPPGGCNTWRARCAESPGQIKRQI